MRSIFTHLTAGTLIAATTLASFGVAPAAARDRHHGHRDRERAIERYCDHHRGNRDCRDFRRGHGHWDDRHYQRFYRTHRSGFDNGAAVLFGLAAGAIAGAAANSGSSNSHVARCEARYRSYNRRTDSYLGYDGRHHRCTL
ncbi:BA14K family protein [Mangrovibrevibacter kandeliae]|uniref:BA14K family protein n=1 Tax=Mangrovibrevibacter kandeliae TaxID=2968473 RepID=UPI0021182D97|nr:BA14K family protein [Aurantimonas sp. CSK15Z-1]MCQ8782020.1 BA14K family protein [Aurantimonas sp. CSK15Z-1]